MALPAIPGIALYLKDEASHPTGSLKHRLARSLFLYGLCNGWVDENMPIVEASSGSTAISEAYFARMLGLPFIAVVPRTTAAAKIAAIESYGGTCHLVGSAAEAHLEAELLATRLGGHYMDQFTYAERATDWRGNNNIAESIFAQMAREPAPLPTWVVCGAGTGGTSATIGRYVRYNRHPTRLCVADPEASIFHQHWSDRAVTDTSGPASVIEGIGRPRLEGSFLPSVIDRMVPVPDSASIAAARVLSAHLGRLCGGSTGTNLWACASLIMEMCREDVVGSVVSILCDSGDRYRSSYFDDAWLCKQGIDIRDDERRIREFIDHGEF